MSAGRIFASLLAARATFGLAVLAVSLGELPIPHYFPLEHRWSIEARPEGFAMSWYGVTAAGLASALLGAALVWLLGSLPAVGRAFERPSIVLSLARAGGLILLLDFAYFGWVMTHQTPVPLPLPAWYCPR